MQPSAAGRLVNQIGALADMPSRLPPVERSRDPRDDFLLALCEAGAADRLVTGDNDDLLAFDPDAPTVTGGYDGDHGVSGLFVRLLTLSDNDVQTVLAIVMAETLEAGSAVVELLGSHLGIDMAKVWQHDDALLDLIRDREVLGAVLREVAGEDVAKANDAATGKVKRRIIRDCITGENGRAKVTGWVPRWLAFPPSAYTDRGGVGSVERAAIIAGLTERPTAVPAPLRIAA